VQRLPKCWYNLNVGRRHSVVGVRVNVVTCQTMTNSAALISILLWSMWLRRRVSVPFLFHLMAEIIFVHTFWSTFMATITLDDFITWSMKLSGAANVVFSSSFKIVLYVQFSRLKYCTYFKSVSRLLYSPSFHLIIVFGDDCGLLSLYFDIFSSLLALLPRHLNILLSTLFSDTIKLCFPYHVYNSY
jgi:hypothetical protein